MENFYSQNNYNNMYNNNMYNNEREKIRQSKFFKDCMKKILIDIIVWACVGILYISIAYVGYLNDIRSLAFFGAGFFWLLIYVIIRIIQYSKFQEYPEKLEPYWHSHKIRHILMIIANIISPILAVIFFALLVFFIVIQLFSGAFSGISDYWWLFL